MLKNYVLVALRNIRKHRTFSFINIFGLAMAMSICMGIMMLVADQVMMDRHNEDHAKIFRINSVPIWTDANNARGNETATSPLPVRDELLTKYTGVKEAVRMVRGFGNLWIEVEPSHDINVPVSGFFADPEVLSFFKHELKYGNPNTALLEPYSVVLTEKAARKLFSMDNPVGESLKVGKLGTYKVTGVIKETENRSHIVAEAYASISTVKSLEAANILGRDVDDWNNFTSGWIYVLLEDGKTQTDLEAQLSQISKDHYATLPPGQNAKIEFATQNLLSIVPGPMMNNPIGPFMPWVIIYFLAGLAGIVLITSCFNFTNLSVARSLSRAREIGVRKVTGAIRWQIFVQFLSESVVIALFALVLSLVMVYALKPFVEGLQFAQVLQWKLSANYLVYAIFLVFAVVVGILAGLFPAGVLSGLQPVKVLKNLGNTRLMSKTGLRKVLLVMQFSLSMIFILTVIVLYNQLDLFMHNDNGFSTENKLIIQKGEGEFTTLKAELQKQSSITSVSLASHIPLAGIAYGMEVKKSSDEKDWSNMNYFSVDEDYLKNMDIPLVGGRFFTEEAGSSNQNFIVINEEAVKHLQFESVADAIGKTLIFERDSSEKQIIGVVRNYYHEVFDERLKPLALLYNPEEFRLIQVAYTGDFKNASTAVDRAWATVNPTLKADIKDFKEQMSVLFDLVFGTFTKVITFIAFVAIVISCLGLLGMATYTIESRKKEIAIRKIVGSSNRSLVYILSKGYLSILLIALVIAVPAAYFINTAWLQALAYHVTVDWLTISIGVLILAFFGIFTIGSQTIQAAWVNPVENLKSE